MSKVYFADMRASHKENLFDKISKLLALAGLSQQIADGDLTAVKIHFGEKGNSAFIRPIFARRVVEEIKKLGARPFLTDSSTLYPGERKEAVSALTCAIENGFGYACVAAPLIISDGLRGVSETEVAVDGEVLKKVYIGSEIVEADSLVCLTHFKCHELTGFGGAIKNLGMGCASRAGKLDQHSVAHPRVQAKSCRDCGLCFDHCPSGAIVQAEGRVSIDDARCLGCGECLVVCKFGAIRVRWDEDYRRIQEKIAEYALLVRRGFKRKAAFLNFLIRVTKDCDCMAKGEAAIVDDIGILASADPVAVDQASADLVLRAAGGRDVFRQGYDIDWSMQLSHGEKIGLGSTRYALTTIEA